MRSVSPNLFCLKKFYRTAIDWNDALLGKKDQRLIDQGEIDFDYFEFAKAQEAERQQEQAKQKEREERTSGFRR